ncbi:hypothetical protein PS15p_205720 [Mucor circinelloides]
MKEILDYLQYDYLICFGFDAYGRAYIIGSSNRAISVEELQIEAGIDDEFSLPQLLLSGFKESLTLLSKDNGQLSQEERWTLSFGIDHFKEIKQKFSKKYGISFDKAQILFILPVGWTEEQYKYKLLTFFSEAEWITPKDNESKLVMTPFIQVLADDFQKSAKQKRHLDRERASLLISMQPASEDDSTKFSCTIFQMQSAKELIAVSRTLASSDFLLAPSIRNSKSIYLANWDNVIHNSVKQIITRIQGKHSKQLIEKYAVGKEDPVLRIVSSLPAIYNTACADYNTGLESCLRGLYWNTYQIQDLRSWSCGQLIATIFADENVKQYFKQVSDFLKSALGEYGSIKNSPDGIQHVLLYNNSTAGPVFRHCIMQELINEDIIQPGNKFIKTSPYNNAMCAMQKSLKMIQIANAILPPVIVNEDTQDDSVFQMDRRSDKLTSTNSFYVQASITDTHISVILNKVVVPPSFKNAAKIFTVQERSVEIEDITGTVSHLLWNHYQSMNDGKENQHSLFKYCQEHDGIVFSFKHYKQFKKDIKKLIVHWFETNDAPTSEGFDTYYFISVDERCACAVNLSQRLLLEVGLKPAVANIAGAVIGALFSDEFFGLYQISALIVRKNLNIINNLHFSYLFDCLLKKALQGHLQVHRGRISLLFQDKQADSNVTQYLGRGNYSQVSGTTWTFKFEMWRMTGKKRFTLGLQEDGECKRLLTASSTPGGRHRRLPIMYEYIALTKGEELPLAGLTRTFLVKNASKVVIGIYASDSSQGSAHQYRVWSLELGSNFAAQLCSPVSVKISPEHHSSTVKISASYSLALSYEFTRLGRHRWRKMNDLKQVEKSVNVHERLFLKKH